MSGPKWQRPVRWTTVDLHYIWFYLHHARKRPRRELVGLLAQWVIIAALFAWAIATGHATELLLLVLVPQRLAILWLAFAFDYLPHHGLTAKPTETIENATAFWDGTGNQWVMLFSQGDWKTSEYRTVMAYCLGPNLDATCNIQGPRGSFPFNPKGFGIYGSGGMDVFRRADGQLQAVWHFWGSNDPWTRGDRKTAQSGISVTYPTN